MTLIFLMKHEMFWSCENFSDPDQKKLPVITRVISSETGVHRFKKHYWIVTTHKNQVYSVCRNPNLQKCDKAEMNRIRLAIFRIQETTAKEAKNRNNNKINKDGV